MFSGRDTNSILERLMAAKLQRERRLQEDDSELGSLPSICFMKQQLRKDSAARDSRIHKLSFSDRGDLTSYMGSPMDSVPRIVVHDGIAETEAETSLTPDESPEKASESEIEGSNLVKASKEVALTSSRGQEETELTRISADEVTSNTGDDLFVDAESMIVGDGTNTERSDFYTPPTTPPDSPEPEGAPRPMSQLNGDVHRKSDSGVRVAYCPLDVFPPKNLIVIVVHKMLFRAVMWKFRLAGHFVWNQGNSDSNKIKDLLFIVLQYNLIFK